MDVKQILRENNVPLSKFADDFKISRNTAMMYISKYEQGEKIPKEKYQIVFDRLFDLRNIDKFELNYASLKHLIQRDEYNGILELSPKMTDAVMSIFNNIIATIDNNTMDDNLIYFLEACIYNYSRENVFKTLAKYFYCFNNYTEEKYYQLPEEERAVFTNYFKVFTMQKQGFLDIDQRIESMLVSRLAEINTLKEYKKSDVQISKY